MNEKPEKVIELKAVEAAGVSRLWLWLGIMALLGVVAVLLWMLLRPHETELVRDVVNDTSALQELQQQVKALQEQINSAQMPDASAPVPSALPEQPKLLCAYNILAVEFAVSAHAQQMPALLPCDNATVNALLEQAQQAAMQENTEVQKTMPLPSSDAPLWGVLNVRKLPDAGVPSASNTQNATQKLIEEAKHQLFFDVAPKEVTQ